MILAPSRPWTPESTRSCLRGRLVLKLAAGEADEAIPHYLDVRARRAAPRLRVDGGPIDRVLRAHSSAFTVVRAFRPASRLGTGARDRWTDVEQRTGLASTLRIDVDPEAGLLPLVRDLANLASVVTCSPHYLCVTPFHSAGGAPGVLLRTPPARPFGPSPPPAEGYSEGWDRALVRANEGLAFEPGDTTVVVAVIDSGASLEHPELVGRLRRGFDTVDLPGDRVSRGVTLLGDNDGPDRIPRDEVGHGTACASILGARGLEMAPGVGGASWVLPMRALASARFSERGAVGAIGAGYDIDEAVKLAVDLGARVLNLSFGTPLSALRETDPIPHEDIVRYATERGCILVAAAGNDGKDTVYYPAALEGVIAVGAVGSGARPAHFSTRGPHVALSAPGEKIRAAALEGISLQSGTSFAAPFVAGACALLCARAARYGVPLAPAAAKQMLVESARPFDAGVASQGMGAGVLDVLGALERLESALADGDSADVSPLRSPVPRSVRAPPRRDLTPQKSPPQTA